MSLCEVRSFRTAATPAAAAAAAAAALRGCFSNAEEGWVGIIQLVFRMTRTHAQAHTHTQKHSSWLSQKDFEVRLLLYHGYRNVKKLTV